MSSAFIQPDPNAIPICNNTSHTFSLAVATGGTGTITYQWEQSTNNSTWTNAIGTSTSASYTTPNLTSNTYYRRKATTTIDGTITSNSALVTIAANITQSNPASATISSGTTYTFNLAAASGGVGTTTYQWEQSTNNSTWTNAIGTSTNANYTTPALTTDTYYRRKATNTCGGTITSASALVTTSPIFVPVTNIIGVPTTATAGIPLTLTGTVVPSNATNKTIVWSIQSAGTTGATISGNTLNTTTAGIVTVKATITNGLTASSDYTQNFNITVSDICTDVAPLLTTQWDQCLPYNTQCPTFSNAPYGYAPYAPAGCVAIATAQIMRYWSKAPRNHMNQGAITFDWNKMLDSYPVSYSGTTQENAVAKLIRKVGDAVNMQYSANGSGSNINNAWSALTTYFNYNSQMQLKYRQQYTDIQWEQLLRSELEAKRPIYYRGDNGQSGANYTGHAFVCDGYKCSDNTFHFNWGWGGSADGYFVISVLNPLNRNYTYSQGAIINIEPNDNDFTYPTDNDGINTFAITSNAGSNGSIVPSGSTYVYLNSNQPYTFEANEGYEIDKVFIDGIQNDYAKTNGFYYFENITANHSIIVTFKASSNGIEEIKSTQNVLVFPNPAQSELFIKSDLQIEKVEIYTVVGSLVFSENNFKDKISVSSLPQGFYVLKVYTDNGMVVRKFVKQ